MVDRIPRTPEEIRIGRIKANCLRKLGIFVIGIDDPDLRKDASDASTAICSCMAEQGLKPKEMIRFIMIEAAQSLRD